LNKLTITCSITSPRISKFRCWWVAGNVVPNLVSSEIEYKTSFSRSGWCV